MRQVILVGCDLHDDSLVLQVSVGAEAPALKKYGNNSLTRAILVRELRALAVKHSAERIVFA